MSNKFISYLRNLGVKLKLIKDVKQVEVKVELRQSDVDTIREYHNINIEEEVAEMMDDHFNKSELNQISVKTNVVDDIKQTPAIKVKRKYTKRADKTKKPKTKKTEKDVNKKTRNRKPGKKDSSV